MKTTKHSNVSSADAPSSCLSWAAMKGCEDVVVELLDMGHDVDVDTYVDGGMTPLMWATVCKRREMVVLLLSRGADPYRENQWGVSSMDIAKRYGMEEVFLAFFEREAFDKEARKVDAVGRKRI